MIIIMYLYNRFYFRGDSFRRTLERIGEIQSILPDGVPVIALTATATTQLGNEVIKIIGMYKPQVVAMSPNKENIIYNVGHFSSIEVTFSPILSKLCVERVKFPRMIICTRSFVLISTSKKDCVKI